MNTVNESEEEKRKRIEAAKKLTAPKGPEKRIAILTCNKSSQSCTGAACFWAVNEKERSFAQYRQSEIPVKLWAFFHCGGCADNWGENAGFQKKLQRLKEEFVEKVHLGVCICNNCSHIDQIKEQLELAGLHWEEGTH